MSPKIAHLLSICCQICCQIGGLEAVARRAMAGLVVRLPLVHNHPVG